VAVQTAPAFDSNWRITLCPTCEEDCDVKIFEVGGAPNTPDIVVAPVFAGSRTDASVAVPVLLEASAVELQVLANLL
jgi:hypothetical protein